MNEQDFSDLEGALVRQYEYDDGRVLAVDLGTTGTATVDVVDGTAIVVVDDRRGEFQTEIDLPDDAQAFIRNGVLSIEVKA